MVALTASAETFSGTVPSRTYRVRGLKIRVPSNYNPLTREYTGVWDGTFKTEWTDNPAWVFYDIVTNDRYGIAKYLPSTFTLSRELCDKWFLYSIAQICDEPVSDGFGGTEPRYTFNYQIMGAGDAKEVLQSIASVFHGMTYWSSGLVYARADFPADPVRTITQANVKDGVITYASASMQERHSVALVTWNNPDDMGRAHIEAVYDWELYRQIGYRPVEAVAYGCTSRGQAHRHGRWLLVSEKNQWTATVEMGLDAFDLLPGDVVRIADPAWMGFRASGRVKSVDSATVTLDAPFEAAEGEVCQLSICTLDGKEETRLVAQIDGAVVTAESPFSGEFAPNAVWSMSSASAQPRQFRVQNIRETDTASVQIELIEHNPDKFLEIEQNLVIEDPPSRRALKTAVTAPENLTVRESTATVNARLVQKALFCWGYSAARFDVTEYQVMCVDPLENRKTGAWQNDSSFELTNISGGEWTFRVRARTFDGRVSQWAELSAALAGIAGLTASDVPSLELSEWGYMQRDGVHISNVDVVWETPDMPEYVIGGFEVWTRYSTASPWQLYTTAAASERLCTIDNALTGSTLHVMVKTKSVLDVRSSGVEESLAIVGKDARPQTPLNFTAVQNPNDRTQLLLRWDAVDEPDIAGYRVYVNGAEAVARTSDTSTAVAITLEGRNEIQLCTLDNSGQESSPAVVSGFWSFIPSPPSNLSVSQDVFDTTRLVISWTPSPDSDVVSYEVRDGISWTTAQVLGVTGESRLTVTMVQSHEYAVMVRAKNRAGYESTIVRGAHEATLEPANVTGFQAVQDGSSADLYWTKAEESDIAGYEIREGFTWETASVVLTGVTQTEATIPLSVERSYRFMIKAVNRAGYSSPIAASALLAVEDLPPKNVLQTWDDIALGDGTHDCTQFAQNPQTFGNTPGTFADYSAVRWVDLGTSVVLTLTDGAAEGVWTSPVRDLGRVLSANISSDFMTLSRSGTTAVLEYRSSKDGEVWTPWRALLRHLETMRYVQYRVVMTNMADLPPCVTVLSVTVDMPDVMKAGRALIAPGGTVIEYGFEYAAAPVVVVTADGADKRAVLSGAPGLASCTVNVLDASGASAEGTVNWNSYGY